MVDRYQEKLIDQQGFTLLEVLISIGLLLLLFFSLIATEWNRLTQSKSAYYLSVAIQQVVSLREYANILNATPSAEDLLTWNQENCLVLPSGKGMIQGEYPYFLIKIAWGAVSMHDCIKLQLKSNGGCYLSNITKDSH